VKKMREEWKNGKVRMQRWTRKLRGSKCRKNGGRSAKNREAAFSTRHPAIKNGSRQNIKAGPSADRGEVYRKAVELYAEFYV